MNTLTLLSMPVCQVVIWWCLSACNIEFSLVRLPLFLRCIMKPSTRLLVQAFQVIIIVVLVILYR